MTDLISPTQEGGNVTEPGVTVPEADQGNWWQWRKTWQKVLLIAGGVFLVLAVAGSIAGKSETSGQAASDTAETGSEPPDATTSTEAEATTTTQSSAPGVGDPVRDGQFEFVVTGIEDPGAVYQPEGLLRDEANGSWLVVYVTVENVGDREQAFLTGNQRILWDGKEYGGEGFTWNGANAEDLNPGVVLEATLMFDLPDGFPRLGTGTILELHDSVFSGGVNVSL